MVKVVEQDLRSAAKLVGEKIKTPLLIAEIGTCSGKNAIRMLKGMDIARLYLVDSYPVYIDGPYERGRKIQDEYYRVMFSNIQPYLSKITLVTRDSVIATKLFKDDTFDFVYIDGYHSYGQCKKDVEAWWPKVKRGGILGGHDIGHIDFPGVAKAVDEFSKKIGKEVKSFSDTDWVIEKS